jgi:hypothetical protein
MGEALREIMLSTGTHGALITLHLTITTVPADRMSKPSEYTTA